MEGTFMIGMFTGAVAVIALACSVGCAIGLFRHVKSRREKRRDAIEDMVQDHVRNAILHCELYTRMRVEPVEKELKRLKGGTPENTQETDQ